jgi:hypothetical protein
MDAPRHPAGAIGLPTETVCPTCGTELTTTSWCERCQRRIGTPAVVRVEQRSSSRRPRRWMVKRRYLHLTAALMSLLIPGAGQIYKGRTLAGVIWLVVVGAAYWAVGAPGLMVHLMCVVTAGSAARVKRRVFVWRPATWTG